MGLVKANIPKDKAAFAFANFDGSLLFIHDGFDTTDEVGFMGVQPISKMPLLGISSIQNSIGKQEFLNFIRAAKAKISNAELKKVVTARVLCKRRSNAFDPMAIFQKACVAYPNTFCSLVYVPGGGVWVGATPEVLVAEKNDQLISYSLAGTVTSEQLIFGEKEKEEQELVSNFIETSWEQLAKVKPHRDKVQIVRNGSLQHLRTVFSMPKSQSPELLKVAKQLHPTPAIAGLPRRKALAFLKKSEGFNRSFYSGYLGPLNHDGNNSLWVNLRCLQVTDTQLLLYAGCGITKASVPISEWHETTQKLTVLKNLL